MWFVRQRRDIHFGKLYWLFAAFIFSCGAGHLIEATIFWHPWYRVSALSKIITATASWATVVAVFRVMPTALELPGLARMNATLEREVETRRRAEAQLVEQAAELERVNAKLHARNLELAQFTRMAGHDLREPLRKLRMFSDLLVEDIGTGLSPDAQTDLDIIIDAANRMDTMVEALLRLSRVGARDLMRAEVPMARVAQAAIERLAEQIEESGAQVVVHDLPIWGVDEGLATQLLANLIDNGIKYVRDRTPEVHVRAVEVHTEEGAPRILEPTDRFDVGGDQDNYGGRVTDASVSSDGQRLAVLTYHAVFFFGRPARRGAWLSNPLGSVPLQQRTYRQCEAIAWQGSDLLITNEGGRIFRLSDPLGAR